MAFPRPNRNNQMRNALNTPARQRLAAMRGQMFPQQNPGLRPPTPPPPPQVQAAAQAQPQTRAATAPKPQYTPEQTAALQGLSGQFANLGQGINVTNPTIPPPRVPPVQPPTSTPPAPVGPGEISPEDVANAPYMSEEGLRVQAAEGRRREQQLAAINQQRQALGIGYGLGEFGGDAENNPYSRAALLQRNYERNQRASLNSMAAQGQLYSGSLSNARNFNRFNYDVGYDSMRKQYDAALARLNQQELEANTRYDDAYEAALREDVDRGQEYEEPTPEEADQFPNQGGQGGGGQGGGGQGGGGAGGRPAPKKVAKASQQRIKGARQRINRLQKARSKAKTPKQRQRITQKIKANRQVVNRNQKRLQNIKQGKPPNKGIKPRPKKGKK